jgi:hypothetical protein
MSGGISLEPQFLKSELNVVPPICSTNEQPEFERGLSIGLRQLKQYKTQSDVSQLSRFIVQFLVLYE